MNSSSLLQPKVYRCIERISAHHDRDAPILTTGDPATWGRDDPCPEAIIFTLDPGERIADTPRYCVSVCIDEEGIYCSDGYYAIESHVTIAVSSMPFPELSRGLRILPRELNKLIPKDSNQAPHMFVKAAHEGLWRLDDDPDNSNDRFGAGALLCTLMQWDGMNSEKWGWRKRAHSVLKKKQTQGMDEAQTDRFRKYCSKVGLSLKSNRTFKAELDAMWAALKAVRM